VITLVIDFDENMFRSIVWKEARKFGLSKSQTQAVIEKALSAIYASSRPVRY
jgi:hypothetical protein